MAWFGPRGDCGCCGVGPPHLPCLCPDNQTQSRGFLGTPTVRAIISGLPLLVEFDCTWASPLGQTYWTTITITGLNQMNGTYMWELPKSGNCIDLSQSLLPQSHNFSISQYTFNRILTSGTSACNVVTTTDNSTPMSASVTMFAHGSGAAPYVTISSGISQRFSLLGRQNHFCEHLFDATADPTEMQFGISVGTGASIMFSPADQEIQMLHLNNSAGRDCVTGDLAIFSVAGSIESEILDIP